MGFQCGIVGLPNVGKSTIFNALTAVGVEAANYPFCTIEPNTGVVAVPDARLSILSEIASSVKIIPTTIEFVDIAGLVKGASEGEGLGNQFLGHIRAVDAIVHVVRCFQDENVTHVHGKVDPEGDIDVIGTELLLADLSSVERRIDRIQRKAKSGDKEAREELALLDTAKRYLDEGVQLRTTPEGPELASLELLTSKPVLFVGNVNEDLAAADPSTCENEAVKKLYQHAQKEDAPVLLISGQVEAEVSQLEEDEKKEFLHELGLERSGLERLAVAGYQLLDLITFFTVGPKETHAWTCERNTAAPQAAGKIHTDFEKGFIRAEVISYDDFISCKGELGAREQGKMRVEGKTYIVKDGDIVHFRFNV
ncbi:MAG: redox-regulated ATPase YchF [Bdellovibrionales bacterium]|nr:redox-regulated ATPase YchF [Bdellovibrionales bacterium]